MHFNSSGWTISMPDPYSISCLLNISKESVWNSISILLPKSVSSRKPREYLFLIELYVSPFSALRITLYSFLYESICFNICSKEPSWLWQSSSSMQMLLIRSTRKFLYSFLSLQNRLSTSSVHKTPVI